MTNVASSILIVVVAVIVMWIVASMLGFNMALGPSLLMSVLLTAGLALILGLFRRP